jgi:hypothetical protein
MQWASSASPKHHCPILHRANAFAVIVIHHRASAALIDRFTAAGLRCDFGLHGFFSMTLKT